LVEVVISLMVSVLAVSGIVCGYLFSINSAQKSSLSLSAQALALERLEQTRGAKWDMSAWPMVDEVVQTNFPDQVVILDHAGSGGGIVYGTNLTQITLLSTVPPIKKVRIDCIWSYKGDRLLTNTIETCRAPDQ
jgi:type II secretory pathway pseudopilin PulG